MTLDTGIELMPLDPWSYAAKTRNEYAEQVALFMWANMACRFGPIIANDPHSYNVAGFAKTQFEGKGGLGYKRYSAPVPELEWLHAIKNQGHGDAVRGAMSKAEGVKEGVFDVFLPVPVVFQPKRHPESGWAMNPPPISYHGFYIELKRMKSERGSAGVAKPAQLQFQAAMRSAGYKAEIVVGWELASKALLAYLGRDGEPV